MMLPDLQSLSINDERLCGHARDREAVLAALAAGARQLDNARRSNDLVGIVRGLGYCAEAERLLGAYDAAMVRVSEALDIARMFGDVRLQRANTIRLGELARSRGDYAAAIRILGEARQTASRDPDRYLLDFALQHLGKALWNAGRTDEAILILEEALALRHQAGKTGLIASTGEALAAACRDSGRELSGQA